MRQDNSATRSRFRIGSSFVSPKRRRRSYPSKSRSLRIPRHATTASPSLLVLPEYRVRVLFASFGMEVETASLGDHELELGVGKILHYDPEFHKPLYTALKNLSQESRQPPLPSSSSVISSLLSSRMWQWRRDKKSLGGSIRRIFTRLPLPPAIDVVPLHSIPSRVGTTKLDLDSWNSVSETL